MTSSTSILIFAVFDNLACDIKNRSINVTVAPRTRELLRTIRESVYRIVNL